LEDFVITAREIRAEIIKKIENIKNKRDV